MNTKELFERFHEAATNPEALMKRYIEEGKPVVLVAPVYTPEEIIHSMGFDGKSIVNPRQIPIVHEIYTPKEKDVIFAEKVIKEIDTKKAQGIGVFTVDGKMIDIAFYDGAKRTIALAKASGVYKGDL